MTAQLLYLIGTLCSWVGITCVGVALFRIIDIRLTPEGPARDASMSSLRMLLTIAAVCLLLAFVIPMDEANDLAVKAGAGKWRFPLVWPVLPFSGWGALFSLIMGARILFMETVLSPGQLKADPAMAKRPRKFRNAFLWLGLGAVFIYFFLKEKEEIVIVRGGIYLAPERVLMIVLFAALALGLMALAAQATRSRGLAKSISTQLALLIGSVVFGLPFAWALITSFKEDVDMSSKDGLIWIPRVQQTVPFRDPQNPIYETSFAGRTVTATLVEKNGENIKLDVQHPLVLRGRTVETTLDKVKEVDQEAPIVTGSFKGTEFKGYVVKEEDDGKRRVRFTDPANLKDQEQSFIPDQLTNVRNVGLRTKNYPEALEYLPVEANYGLVYLKNTLFLVILSVIGTVLSSSLVAYAFARMQFPAKGIIWNVLLSTMMLPGAVTLLPQFLIFKSLGWIDTLNPLWVPSFFANAYFVFMLRQFFSSVPMELEDASKVDGCSYLKSYWQIMLPQVKPALAVVAIWTFMGVWNNFQGPLVYINSPEKMPITYALQLFQGDRFGEPGLLMAFAVLTVLPVLLLFFVAQRYFIEGVSLSGLGGR